MGYAYENSKIENRKRKEKRRYQLFCHMCFPLSVARKLVLPTAEDPSSLRKGNFITVSIQKQKKRDKETGR